MKDELREQLSAFVDDELSREEIQFLTRRVCRSAEAGEQLGRYFLVRDALHRDVSMPPGEDLAARVADALEGEEKLDTGGSSARLGRFMRPLAGAAIAASVALVAVGLWPRGGSDMAPPQQAQSSVAEYAGGMQPVSDGARLVSDTLPQRRWERLDPGVKQRLNGYLINHSEHSSTGQLGGVLTYVRIAGHEGDQ
jgi:sigma-E factor negative regulatory protein RseA